MGNYRYYMSLPDIIKSEELPDKWGLLYVYPKQVKQIMKPKSFTEASIYETPILCSALRRVYLRGDLRKIYNINTLESK